MVPELVELVRTLDCTSAVLDGETLALDDSGRLRPFQEMMSRFGTVDLPVRSEETADARPRTASASTPPTEPAVMKPLLHPDGNSDARVFGPGAVRSIGDLRGSS